MATVEPAREKSLNEYRKKLLEHKEVESRLKEMREQLKELTKQYDKSENDLKALQSVGQYRDKTLANLLLEMLVSFG